MSVIVHTSLGRFRKVAGPETVFVDRWLFECPGCGTWAYLDDDQWHGRVSVDHSGHASVRTTYDLYGHLDAGDVAADHALIEGRG